MGISNKKRYNWWFGILVGGLWCALLLAQIYLAQKAFSNQKKVFHNMLDGALEQCLSTVDTVIPSQFDSLISGGLINNGITDESEIGLYNMDTERFVYYTKDSDTIQLTDEGFEYNFLCVSACGSQELYTIYVHLPDLEHRFRLNLLYSLMVMFVLALLILLCFVKFFFGIRRQYEINRFRERMVHNIVHELKTPLTTIDLASQFLQDKSLAKDEATMDSYLKMISEETKSIQTLVDEVLTVFSSNDLLERNKTDVYIHKLLKIVENIHHLAIVECNGVVNFDFQADRDVVYGDLTHLSNAFSNLIDNAIKYRKGDLELTIATRNVGNAIEISFTDTGLGIEQSNLPFIFEPFARFNTDNEHYVKGYGLGLDYVNQVVKNHKGSVKVESELNQGSTFVVTLPLKTN